MLRTIRLAFVFLTRLPLPGRADYQEGDFPKSFLYFPLVGLSLGLFLAGLAWAFIWVGVDDRVSAFILIFTIVMVTGGLHLDGLADMVDGFFCGKGTDDMLRIMREPSAGPFGMTAIFLVLIGKFAALWHILEFGNIANIIPVFAMSRWGMAFASFEAVYPRPAGAGKAFIGKVSPLTLIYSLVFALLVTFYFARKQLVVFFVVTFFITYAVRHISDAKIGGVTGDVLGAINEVLETTLLLAI
ncbi:MAG: adenosylcobinamide-GDP ribazoletransferase [Nitrospinae bacterium]|nr:adenosylcobinamide-GDP ribazoletransferase [Nitrospinota bacterium]